MFGPENQKTSLFGQSNTTTAASQLQQQQPTQTQTTGFTETCSPFGATIHHGAFGGFQPASQPQPFGSGQAPTFGSGLRYSAPQPPPADEEDEEFEEFIQPSEPITIVTETPIAISFSVSGESNIPSDGVDHQVSVAVLPFSVKISYIAIPRIDPRVFLQVFSS